MRSFIGGELTELHPSPTVRWGVKVSIRREGSARGRCDWLACNLSCCSELTLTAESRVEVNDLPNPHRITIWRNTDNNSDEEIKRP